ncbi:hypothetical protein Pcinc_029964 [Petrolisthes cinctipes]|uniref:Uncharacterized protein n=1 Tax=Petrolisthes cinctipes TaxID=88211 RepID=A0AAE1K392_PETCI|nr:hypothetical protein Pcinc_029964 [Petrolisthes cinctipes]
MQHLRQGKGTNHDQPDNQPISQPTNQPANQPTNKPTNQQTNQPTNQPCRHCKHNRRANWMDQSETSSSNTDKQEPTVCRPFRSGIHNFTCKGARVPGNGFGHPGNTNHRVINLQTRVLMPPRNDRLTPANREGALAENKFKETVSRKLNLNKQ